MKRIPFFRAGRHRSNGGDDLAFSEADLKRCADVYNPATWRAPFVVGHPKMDAPAYGGVNRIEFSDGQLAAIPGTDTEPQFSEMVRSGRFPNVSASFYPPHHGHHPLKGGDGEDAYYVRHIGFLGATPPALKGLPGVQFAAGDEDIVEIEFSERDEAGLLQQLGGLLKRLLNADQTAFAEPDYAGPNKSYPIADAGAVKSAWDLAGKAAIPDHVRRRVIEIAKAHGWTDALPAAAHDWAKQHNLSFSETQEVTDVTTEELDRREAEIKAREEKLKAEQVSFAERETQITRAEKRARRESATQFVENFVSGEHKGRLLPREKAPLIELLCYCEDAGAGKTLEFAEGADGETAKKTPAAILREFIEGLGERVDFSEHSKAAGTETGKPQRLADRMAARFKKPEAIASATH